MARIAIVDGYHGTSANAAAAILAAGKFRPSDNEGDWLGWGIYLWQDAPQRVWEWLRMPRQQTRLGPDVAVIRARLHLPLDECIDLLDTRWVAPLRATYWTLVGEYIARGGRYEDFPTQTVGFTRPAPHPLDRMVVDRLVEAEFAAGTRILAVRAAFPEGEPIFPSSALYDRAHVQIAVRDDRLITDLRPEPSLG